MRRSALVLSPFATAPLDAGQRKRAMQTTRLLKDLGYRVTYLLYAFERGWRQSANEGLIDQMRAQWDELIVHPAGPKTGLPPEHGATHHLDEWWDDGFGTFLHALTHYRFFDLVVVHNVWLSKAFDIVPGSSLKILDSHDVFSSRIEFFRERNGPPEFFLPSPEQERVGIGRADVVLAIQEAERQWFAAGSSAAAVTLAYQLEPNAAPPAARRDYLHPRKVRFGILASPSVFNTVGVESFLSAVKEQVKATFAPAEVLVAGNVCDRLYGRGPWQLLGPIDDEEAFLGKVDFVLAPIFFGSGFKIKVADAVFRGLPVIAASHAAAGVKLPPECVADTPLAMAKMVCRIALERPDLGQFRQASESAGAALKGEAAAGARRVLDAIHQVRRTVVYDLRGATYEQELLLLMTALGAAHVLKGVFKQLIVCSERVRALLEQEMPSGAQPVDASEIDAILPEVALWWGLRPPVEANLPEGSFVSSPVWAACFAKPNGDGAAVPGQAPRPEQLDPRMLWHHLRWDPVVLRVVEALHALHPPIETDLLVISDRVSDYQDYLGVLFRRKLAVLDPSKPGALADMVSTLTSRTLGEVLYLQPAGTPEQILVRNFCVAMKVKYSGAEAPAAPVGQGKEDALLIEFQTYWGELAKQAKQRRRLNFAGERGDSKGTPAKAGSDAKPSLPVPPSLGTSPEAAAGLG